jgi:hypothetical protein
VRVRFGNQSYSLIGNDRVLPWTTINRLEVVFSQDVAIDAADLRLNGVSVSQYGGAFSYNPATRTATLTLGTAIGADRLTLTLDGDGTGPDGNDGVRNLAGAYLAGGDFARSFDVLPGDFNGDGTVTVQDSIGIRNQSPGYGTYLLFADTDGDGDVDLNDINAPRRRLGATLP